MTKRHPWRKRRVWRWWNTKRSRTKILQVIWWLPNIK